MQTIVSMLPLKAGPSEGFGIAFSGGVDSLVLAHSLRKFKPTLYHFNHRLIEEDWYIERKAKKVAQTLKLPFVVGHARETFKKGSTEAWCREQRYNWLKTIGGVVATAHNLSEATESYLMNCFKGCPDYTPIPLQTTFGITTVVRPLILVPKHEIVQYARKHKLQELVIEDPLNGDLTRQRNWVRQVLLPQIESRVNIEKVVKKKYLQLLQKWNYSYT